MQTKKSKILWRLAIIPVLLLMAFGLAGIIYIKAADTSWIEDLGYSEDMIYSLKLDRAGVPMIPVGIGKETYYFIFDTGCGTELVTTNVLEDKIEYAILEKVEQLNRDGSHKGWSYGIMIPQIDLFE